MPRTRNCHLHVYERLWIVSQNRRIGAGNQNRARFFRRLRRIIVLFRVAVRIVQGLITIAMHHVKERHDAHVVTVWLCVNPTVGICQIEVVLADALHIVWGYELQMGKSVRLGVLTVGGTSGLNGIHGHGDGCVTNCMDVDCVSSQVRPLNVLVENCRRMFWYAVGNNALPGVIAILLDEIGNRLVRSIFIGLGANVHAYRRIYIHIPFYRECAIRVLLEDRLQVRHRPWGIAQSGRNVVGIGLRYAVGIHFHGVGTGQGICGILSTN